MRRVSPPRSPRAWSGSKPRNVAARANTALNELARIAFDGHVDKIETERLEPLEDRIQRRLVR